MIIEMNDTELNSLALGIFVDSCQMKLNSASHFDMMETVYQMADCYAYALFTDKEIKPTLTLPRRYIMHDVLEWVQGEKNVPSEWLLRWCNRWYYEYKDKLESVSRPDYFALQTVRAEAKRYLDELRQAEQAVFSDTHFLRPELPKELRKFYSDYTMMQERRHSSITATDVERLLAYGFSCGIRAERQKRRGKA
ncbi:MAG: hypothetical protein IKK51_01185 [Oscillospiraceae bacterium]|nr:hypothetical protein [Oscillospiraceae bacterium]